MQGVQMGLGDFCLLHHMVHLQVGLSHFHQVDLCHLLQVDYNPVDLHQEYLLWVVSLQSNQVKHFQHDNLLHLKDKVMELLLHIWDMLIKGNWDSQVLGVKDSYYHNILVIDSLDILV